VVSSVDLEDPFGVCGRWCDAEKVLPQFRFLEMINDSDETTLVFWMHEPGLVLQVIFVVDKSSQWRNPLFRS
jgi:hypothetical protein